MKRLPGPGGSVSSASISDATVQRPFTNRKVEHLRDIAAALDVTVDDRARLREGLAILVERHEEPGDGKSTFDYRLVVA